MPIKGPISTFWQKRVILGSTCGAILGVWQNFLNFAKKSGILQGYFIVGSIPSGKGDQLLP